MPLQGVHEAQLRGGPCQPAGQGDAAAEDLLHQQGGKTGGYQEFKPKLHVKDNLLLQVNETLLRGVTRRLFFNPGLVASPTLSINLELVKEDDVMEISTESLEVESDPLDDIWSGTGLATDSRVLCSQIG